MEKEGVAVEKEGVVAVEVLLPLLFPHVEVLPNSSE